MIHFERSGGIAENSQAPVKSKFALQDLNHSGAAVQWHNNVKSAARSRKRETASATPITSPSGAGTSICVQCTPRSTDRASASASARPACAAAKSLRLNHSPQRTLRGTEEFNLLQGPVSVPATSRRLTSRQKSAWSSAEFGAGDRLRRTLDLAEFSVGVCLRLSFRRRLRPSP
jgi:hypothetical protein